LDDKFTEMASSQIKQIYSVSLATQDRDSTMDVAADNQ
jgi:hypothetical protein